MTDTNKRPVSPINGQPLPKGKPFEPGDRAREIGRKGGKRSKQVQKERKTLREELLLLLGEEVTDKNTGRVMPTQAAISAALIKQAISGNYRAFEIIRDTIGEKPVEKVAVTTPAPDVIESVEKALFGGDPL